MYNDKLIPLKLVANKTAVRISVESVDNDTVVFNAPDMNAFRLKFSEFSSNPRKVQL